jgi:hypothetical protein
MYVRFSEAVRENGKAHLTSRILCYDVDIAFNHMIVSTAKALAVYQYITTTDMYWISFL